MTFLLNNEAVLLKCSFFYPIKKKIDYAKILFNHLFFFILYFIFIFIRISGQLYDLDIFGAYF